MRKMIFAAAIGLTLLSACNQPPKTTATETATPEKKGVDIKLADLSSNKDHYCGMELEEGAIADTASYNGQTYGFCSAECKEGFMKDPEKYLSTQ